MFDQFRDMRRGLEALEHTLQALLLQTRQAVAQDIAPRMPGEDSGGFAWRQDLHQKPKEPAPAKPPPREPNHAEGPYNDPRGFQGPPPLGARQLPPPKPPPPKEDPRRVVVRFIEDMRAAAVHFHNCSRLLLTIADLVEFKLNDRRPRTNTPNHRHGG